MNIARDKLDPRLREIFDFEIASGNEIVRVDEPAGTQSPLAIVFRRALNRTEIEKRIELPSDVFWHQSADQHYEVNGMAGFASKATHHFVYGPLHDK